MVRLCCPALIHVCMRPIYGPAQITARFVGIQQHSVSLPPFFFRRDAAATFPTAVLC